MYITAVAIPGLMLGFEFRDIEDQSYLLIDLLIIRVVIGI